MGDPIAVRTAVASDIPGVSSVAAESWRSTYAGLIPDSAIEQFLSGAYSGEQLLRTIERFGAGFAIASNNGENIGYAIAGRNRENRGELVALYVRPSWHRRGIGSRLWTACAEHLVQIGCSTMELWVLAGNDNAISFYESRGAQLLNEREFPIGDIRVRELGYRMDLDFGSRTELL